MDDVKSIITELAKQQIRQIAKKLIPRHKTDTRGGLVLSSFYNLNM